MEFELNEEQQLLQYSVRRYVEKEHSFEQRRRRVGVGQAFDRSVWRAFGDMGWLSIQLPENLGGMGQSIIEAALVAEELARAQVLEPYVACGFLPLRILSQFSKGREDLIVDAAAGTAVVALAHSEPQARGNVCDVDVRAQREGGGWRIRGRKSLVVGGPVADWFIVSARTGDARTDERGVSLFLVNGKEPGSQREGDRLADWSSAGDVTFDVLVGPEALISAEGEGGSILQSAIDDAIIVLCAEAVGAMQGAIDTTSEYIKSRKQFGVPIGSFQALKHRMADMSIELVQARSSVNRALQSAQLGLPGKTFDASGCKAMVIRVGKWTTAQGIQLHGGYGMTEEYKVGQYFKRVLMADAMFGRVDFHLNRYAAEMVRRASQGSN